MPTTTNTTTPGHHPTDVTPDSAYNLAYGYGLGVLDTTAAGTSYGVDHEGDVAQFARAYRTHARRHPDNIPHVREAFGEWRTTGHMIQPDR